MADGKQDHPNEVRFSADDGQGSRVEFRVSWGWTVISHVLVGTVILGGLTVIVAAADWFTR